MFRYREREAVNELDENDLELGYPVVYALVKICQTNFQVRVTHAKWYLLKNGGARCQILWMMYVISLPNAWRIWAGTSLTGWHKSYTAPDPWWSVFHLPTISRAETHLHRHPRHHWTFSGYQKVRIVRRKYTTDWLYPQMEISTFCPGPIGISVIVLPSVVRIGVVIGILLLSIDCLRPA